MQRDMDAMRHAQLTGGYGDPSGAGVAKTSSAFSPIQGSMLQTAAAAQAAASQGAFAMSAGSRGYSFYDPIGFPKHHSQVDRIHLHKNGLKKSDFEIIYL